MRSITVIAKGPSSVHATEWIHDAPGTDVAVINDAGQMIPGIDIAFCFFTHIQFSGRLKKLDQPQTQYVAPCLMTHGGDLPPEWMQDRCTQYPERTCEGDIATLTARIVEGGICHHNTVNGAIHWLAKHGKYDQIRIIGVDGGREYAPGCGPVSNRIQTRLENDHSERPHFDVWRDVTLRIAGLLRPIYGVEVVFYGD